MITRIDSGGLFPLQIASKWASEAFDEERKVEEGLFFGEYSANGFAGTFKLKDGVLTFGLRWFKRRGRFWAVYRVSSIHHKQGRAHAADGKLPDRAFDVPECRVSYLDGYLRGIPPSLKGEQRAELERSIHTEIESLLYD